MNSIQLEHVIVTGTYTLLTNLHCDLQIDTQFFWSGVPWEFQARNFTAITLNKGFNTTKYQADNVVYSNAMEGIGFSMVRDYLLDVKSFVRCMYNLFEDININALNAPIPHSTHPFIL